MKLNRRSLLAALLAPFVTVKRTIAAETIRWRPLSFGPMPVPPRSTELSCNALYIYPAVPKPGEFDAMVWGGNPIRWLSDSSTPNGYVVALSQNNWNLLWNNTPPVDRYILTDTSLSHAGFMTFRFLGSEVVIDPVLGDHEVCLIYPEHLRKYSVRVTFNHIVASRKG